MSHPTSLESLRIANPCPASWDAMQGDDRVRFCLDCKLNVYNLSAMTRRDGEALIQSREGRVCVRMFQRTDGTVLTQDCPVGLAALRRKLARARARAAAFAGLVFSFLLGCGRGAEPRTPPTATDPSAVQPLMGDILQPLALQGEIYVTERPGAWALGKVAPAQTPEQNPPAGQ